WLAAEAALGRAWLRCDGAAEALWSEVVAAGEGAEAPVLPLLLPDRSAGEYVSKNSHQDSSTRFLSFLYWEYSSSMSHSFPPKISAADVESWGACWDTRGSPSSERWCVLDGYYQPRRGVSSEPHEPRVSGHLCPPAGTLGRTGSSLGKQPVRRTTVKDEAHVCPDGGPAHVRAQR